MRGVDTGRERVRLYFDGLDAVQIANKLQEKIEDVKFELAQVGIRIQRGARCRLGKKTHALGYSPSGYFLEKWYLPFKDMAEELGIPVGWVNRYYDMFRQLETVDD